MKLVAILTLIISLVSLGLVLRLTLMEPWKSETLEPSPAVVVPPSTPQPTLTECEVLAQQIVDAETELAVIWLHEKAQVVGCSTQQPSVLEGSQRQAPFDQQGLAYRLAEGLRRAEERQRAPVVPKSDGGR